MYLVSIIIINFKEGTKGHFQNWDCRDLKSPELELELELELKSLELELELELKLFVSSGIGIGIGIENNGIGIGIELKKWNWPQPCELIYVVRLLTATARGKNNCETGLLDQNTAVKPV